MRLRGALEEEMFAAMGREDEQVDRTVDYAGLEKATGVKSGDVRSDIFFLGCVFYETLTGKAPLEMTKDRHARMLRRRFEEVKALKPGEITAPPSVFQLCESMLAVDPRRRYQTAKEMADDLRSFMAGPSRIGTGLFGPGVSFT